MAPRQPIRLPERPEALARPAALPFWGERRPPENFAEVFRAYAAEETTEEVGGEVATRQVATLRIYGPIYDGWFGVSARAVAQALDELGAVDEVRVRINSPGGDAWEGMAIMNLLRSHDADVVAVVDGVAASAASVIAAGADRTVMSPGTQMMIHDASAFAYGPAAVMRKAATFLDSVSNAYAELYADAAGQTPEAWRALMVETTWYTAAEAVEAGLADAVAVVKDSGPSETAADDPPDLGDDDEDVEAKWDLSMYPYAGRSKAPAPKPPNASAGGTNNTEGGSAVAFSDEQLTNLRDKLGLPETADEAAIVAAVDAVVEESLEDRPATTEVPEGHVAIPAAKLADLEAAAALATATAKTLHEKERAAFLDSVRAKYLPTSRAGWEAEYDRDPAGVRAHFEKAPELIPVTELGTGSEPEGDQLAIDDAELDAFASQLGLSKEDLRG